MGSKIDARRLMQDGRRAGRAGRDAGRSVRRRRCAGPSSASGCRRWSRRRPAAAARACGASREPRQALDAIQAARREATAAFGDGTLYVERLIERPRHVEVQVIGRRARRRRAPVRARVLGAAPAPEGDRGEPVAGARRRRCARGSPRPRVARRARRGVPQRRHDRVPRRPVGWRIGRAPFYFLEMNTRLQVEHPVTEAVTGVDLVRAQLLVASGEPLPWRQEAIVAARPRDRSARLRRGSGARIPAAGRPLAALPRAAHARGAHRLRRRRRRRGVRPLRSAAREGDRLGRNARARDRPPVRGAARVPIARHPTNIPFLLRHPRASAPSAPATIDTGFLDREGASLVANSVVSGFVLALAAEARQRSRAASGIRLCAGPRWRRTAHGRRWWDSMVWRR